MGWSTDTQQLYIGNGVTTSPDFAPATGLTEILTEHTDILGLIGLYTYQGTQAGYSVITGPSSSQPIQRSLQEKLDDIVDVRDFGAVGDGYTDDTAAINRAIQQIYNTVYFSSTLTRRTINFPGGTYLTSASIFLPPYVKLVGDGRDSTIITCSNIVAPVFQTVDNAYSANGLGTIRPQDVYIQDMQLSSGTGTTGTQPLLVVDSLANGKFVNMKFSGNVSNSANLVSITDRIVNTKNITFDNCTFTSGAFGVNVFSTGSGISSVRINNSSFDNIPGSGYAIGANINGFGSSHNFFGNVGTPRVTNANPTHYQFGDAMTGTGSGNVAGLTLGRLTTSGTVTSSIPTGTATVLGQLSTGSGSFDYQMDNGSAYRSGKVKFTVTGSATTYEDDYTETGTSLGGNLFINNAGYLSLSVTTAATFKYNLTQFI
jgi:polygalacturonase